MLRHLMRNFERLLTLQTTAVNLPLPCLNHLLQRRLIQIEQNPAKHVEDEKVGLEADIGEYIVPYHFEDEQRSTLNAFVEALRLRFHLSPVEVKQITDDNTFRNFRERSFTRVLEYLCSEGVSKRSFLDYPWLITLDKVRVTQKITLIRTMPVRDINHFVPFLKLTLPRLHKLTLALNSETQTVPHGNRVYYISEQLQIDPYLVTKYISKRLFILEMPFEMLEQNLQHMINYKVSPLNVLKDLWAFRYTPKSVQLRLERAKCAKKFKIMPWMVRCPEPILQRSLKLSTDEITVLGGKSTIAEYVAERLQFNVDEAKAIMARHPQVLRVRVTKIKEILDYLLAETDFTRYEIAQVPRILCHSLETTKQRFEQLKSMGCRPSSLVILCRSKREYEKFLRAWMNMQKKLEPSIEDKSNS